MDGRCAAGVSAFGLFLSVVPQERSETLLTIPQQDTIRSWSDEPSAAASADGRTVAFVSYARLAPGDLDTRSDIYTLDRASGRVTLESVTAAAGRIGHDCARPGISRDGRYLVFDCSVPRDGQFPAISVDFETGWRMSPGLSRGAHSAPTKTRGPLTRPSARMAGRSSRVDEDGSRGRPGQEQRGARHLPVRCAERRPPPGQRRQRRLAISPECELLTRGERRRTVRGVYVHGRSRRSSGGAVRRIGRVAPFVVSHLRSRYASQRHQAGQRLPARGRPQWPELASGDQRRRTPRRVRIGGIESVRGIGNAADVFLYDREQCADLGQPCAEDRGWRRERLYPEVSARWPFVAFQSDAADLVCVKRVPSMPRTSISSRTHFCSIGRAADHSHQRRRARRMDGSQCGAGARRHRPCRGLHVAPPDRRHRRP